MTEPANDDMTSKKRVTDSVMMAVMIKGMTDDERANCCPCEVSL